MITIDENNMTIKIETTLSFDKNVVPYINDLKTDMRYDIEHDVDNSLFDDDEKMKIKKFLDYKLKKEDKKNILDKILDRYEYCGHTVSNRFTKPTYKSKKIVPCRKVNGSSLKIHRSPSLMRKPGRKRIRFGQVAAVPIRIVKKARSMVIYNGPHVKTTSKK